MLTLEAKTGEFALGFEGRLMHFNPGMNSHGLRAAIARQFRLPSNTPRAVLLATAAGIDSVSFCCNHTLMPFMRAAIARNAAMHAHGSTEDQKLLRNSALLAGNRFPRLCRGCVTEDLTFLNFSIWRREHQLPGVDWCLKHRMPLAEVTASEGYERIPSNCLDQAIDLTVEDLDDWPALERYCELARSTLSFSRPLAATEVGKLLGKQARKQGIRICEAGTHTLLSDSAQDLLPKSWLSRQIPALVDKLRGTYYEPLDATCRSRGYARSANTILSFALLYPSADEAEQVLVQAQKAPRALSGVKPKGKAAKKIVRGFWDSSEVRHSYIQSEGRHLKMAKAFGLSTAYTRNQLRAIGLPNLGNNIDVQALDAAVDFVRGAPLDNAIVKHGTTRAAVEYWLRQDMRTIARALG